MRTTITFYDSSISGVLKYFILSRLTIPLIFLMTYFQELTIFKGLGISAILVILISMYYFHKDEEKNRSQIVINIDSAIWVGLLGVFLDKIFQNHQLISIIQPLIISVAIFLIVSGLVLAVFIHKESDSDTNRYEFPSQMHSVLTILLLLIPLFMVLTSKTNHIYEIYQSYEWFYPAYIVYEFDILIFMGYYGIMVFISIIETIIFVIMVKMSHQFSKENTEIKKMDIFAQVMEKYDTKNWTYLFILLFFASLWEEVIFRFFTMNLAAEFTIPHWVIILISSVLFGIAHKSGGLFHIISSFNAGIVFAIAYVNYGIFFVWVLHLFWNILVMVQLWITQAKIED